MTKATDRRKSAVKGLTSAILQEFFGQPPLFSASCIFPSYLPVRLLVSCFFSFLSSEVCLFSSSSLLVHLRFCSSDRFGTTSIGFLLPTMVNVEDLVITTRQCVATWFRNHRRCWLSKISKISHVRVAIFLSFTRGNTRGRVILKRRYLKIRRVEWKSTRIERIE